MGGDCVYRFPDFPVVDLGPLRTDADLPASHSPSKADAADLKERQRQTELKQFHAELAETNARAREDVMDGLPPAVVRADRQVYGQNPRGWPPA